jgi:FixJ family two-component response regulator
MVCDVRLPGASGFELHRRIAERGHVPPWIFITAFDNPAVREQAHQAMATCLRKPFEGRALLDLITQVLA